MFTFIVLFGTILLNAIGDAHQAVNEINHSLGTDLNGLLMFLIGWLIATILDTIFSQG